MKFRNGFVSNSSSSSFVVLGFKSNSNSGDPENDIWLDNETYLIGEILGQSDNDYMDESAHSLSTLLAKASGLSLKYGVPVTEIKLHLGTRAC
jgi:hypothetical protein